MQERGLRILALIDEWDRAEQRGREVRIALATRPEFDPEILLPEHFPAKEVDASDPSVYEDPEVGLDFSGVALEEMSESEYEQFEAAWLSEDVTVPGEAGDEETDGMWI